MANGDPMWSCPFCGRVYYSALSGGCICYNSMRNDVNNRELESLRKENAELKLLLEGADSTCKKIAELVGDRGQYRDLVEAVEMKLDSLKGPFDWGNVG